MSFLFKFFIFILFQLSLFSCLFNEDDLKKFKLVNGKEIFASGCEGSLIKVFHKEEKKIYLLKQLEVGTKFNLRSFCNDCMASKIARENGINIALVILIPSEIGNCLKLDVTAPALIIEFIEGETIYSLIGKKEFFEKDFLFNRSYKSLKKCEIELCIKNVEFISIDKELTEIAAFDTFIGNIDRNNNNIIKSNLNKSYWGIDQSYSFLDKEEVAKIFLSRLHLLRDNCFFDKCDKKILSSLALYSTTLKNLIKKWKPEDIINQLKELIIILGCVNLSQENEEDITKNIEYCKKLVEFIDIQILTKQ